MIHDFLHACHTSDRNLDLGQFRAAFDSCLVARQIGPTLSEREAFHIKARMGIAPIGQAKHSFKAHEVTNIEFIGRKQLPVVLEGPQEPPKFPERPVVAIAPGADVNTGVGRRLKNFERGRHAGTGGVAGGPKPDDASPIQSFRETASIGILTEAFDFCAHPVLLSKTTTWF